MLFKFTTCVTRLNKNLNLGKNVTFKKIPEILKHKSAEIIILENTTINSSNYGYHVNMFSKCKLYADRPNSKIKIGKNTRIHGTCIHAYKSIEIGDNCLIAANTQIIDANGHELSFENTSNRINTSDEGKNIKIGNNVWIATNVLVLGGSEIGEGTIITAGSVVKGKLDSNSIYGGNPLIKIKQY
jgi:acetyltransferase-like isoleucine patch superfamily enzyme